MKTTNSKAVVFEDNRFEPSDASFIPYTSTFRERHKAIRIKHGDQDMQRTAVVNEAVRKYFGKTFNIGGR